MVWGRDKSEQQRSILALSFEPINQGYLYYHWRWSRGIPVSAEERDAYLAIPALGSRRAWRRSIAGRPTSPPRSFRPAQQKLLASMPISMALIAFLFGVPLALSGLVELQTISGLVRAVGGLLAVVFGAQIIYAKAVASQRR
ncbi:hypothetical protein NDN01_00345 [Sphingomonas sp. QA11]|uniref:hypothetical protein n=1 Tax=Sphingomonas sp. QA11 TaxID=2950605 RepID=UPI00234B1C7E|nr:hypothetical protein [Sphingomonas sp. QA11]WCM27425.1 hypothetical protein NDN01_00345 [Sphingomonas sp. QA11]